MMKSANVRIADLGLVLVSIAAAWLAACSAAPPPLSSPEMGPGALTGTVVGDLGPIADAVVRIRTTTFHSRTDALGRFTLDGVGPGRRVELTAFAPGYYIAGPVAAVSGDSDVIIRLARHTSEDHPNYRWVGARQSGDAFNCENCHSDRLGPDSRLPFDEWTRDAHASSAVNPRFLSVYNGTDLGGTHRSPQTRFVPVRDYGRMPLPPDPAQPDFGPGYALDGVATPGNCAECHAPAAAAGAPPYSIDPNRVSGAGREGVTCDVCHKLFEVKLAPTTGVPTENMPGVLSMVFRRPGPERQLFIGPLDDVAGDDTFAPIQRSSDACAPCHAAQFWGVPIYDSYGEWRRSAYSDPVNGRTCQDCHMPRRGVTRFVRAARGGLERRPDTIFSHLMPGAADPELLRNTVSLDVRAQRRGTSIEVDVSLTNANAGHAVPTDHPARNMLLVLEAVDAQGRLLTFAGSQVIPEWGGAGPALDDYAGRPGKGYAKILEDRWTGVAPTVAYWRPTIIRADTRLAAQATDVTHYSFLLPATAGDVTVNATVVFRRAFKSLRDAKRWNTPDIEMASKKVLVSREPQGLAGGVTSAHR
jgi:hypothetical protein